VVPLLQERGVLRRDYAEGATLRDHLGLGAARSASDWGTGVSAAHGASTEPLRTGVGASA
jgi:hypothetical protein